MFVKIKKYGFKKSVLILLKKLLGFEILKFHYLIFDGEITDLNKKLESSLDVKILEYDDFCKGDETVFNADKLKLIKQRLESGGYIAYGILENNKLLYSTWISLNYISLPLVVNKFKLEGNEAVLEDSYCSVDARGKGFHSQMNYYRVEKLYNLGKNRIIAIVLDGNTPAFKVQYKTGFKNIGKPFYVISLFGFKFTTFKKENYDC